MSSDAKLVTGKPARTRLEKELAAVKARLGSGHGESKSSKALLTRRKLELRAQLGLGRRG